MYILDYEPANGGIDICFDGEGVHLTEADLCEYDQIIRDYCL